MMLLLASVHVLADVDDQRTATALRMVGHEVLRSLGDSTSRVMPVSKVGDRYRIAFERDFAFMPDVLVTTINDVVQQSGLPPHYVLEVEDCNTRAVVYSFSMSDEAQEDIVPCQGRLQPMGCYELMFTFPEVQDASDEPPAWSLWVGLLLAIGIGLLFSQSERRRKIGQATSDGSPSLKAMGLSQFDAAQHVMFVGEARERVALSGKETALLMLLHDSVNTTVAREVILQKVWGDEGDYVGRTLDVFISKLRKKLEGDPSLKIVNTRGVGYRLVIG